MAYYFTLPQITELTQDQQWAVDQTKPLALGGGPGTGKSVVSLWRHIRNHVTNQRNSVLLTYTKTLEHYLKASATGESEIAGDNVYRVFDWLAHNAEGYEEIIIDEGQDLRKDQFERLFNYTDRISYGADERQIMYLQQHEWDELKNWLGTDARFHDNRTHGTITLQRNFRNSQEILLFTRSVFPNFMIPKNTIDGAEAKGLKPIMKLNLGMNLESQIDAIIDIINDFQSDTHNIVVLVPTVAKVNTYYKEIRKKLNDKIEVTKYQNELDDFEGLSGVHITTFKSSKGTEFDTVIVPDFDSFAWYIKNMDIVSEDDYYVVFTRSKTNLFLLCKNNFPNIGDINTVTIE